MNPFETETMADLFLRQGHRDDALAIYRRLLARAVDDVAVRGRLLQRIAAIEGREDTPPAEASQPSAATVAGDAAATGPPLPTPGLRTHSAGNALTVDWRLPPETSAATLELFLVVRTPAGVATETRSLPLDRPSGRLVLDVAGLHSARAAAGFVSGGRFVPLART